MTLVLSADSRRRIAEQADADAQRAHAKAKKSFKWSLAGFGVALAVATVFPPAALAGVAMLVGVTVGIVSGAYAAGHKANESMLKTIKKESAEDGFAEKMQKRAGRLGNLFRRSDKVSDYGLYAALGLAAVAWFVPPVAPLAWSLYSVAVSTMAAATLVRAVTRDPSASATNVSIATQNLATQDSLAPQPSNQNQPPAPPLSAAPTPAKDFDKVANGAAPEAAKPVEPAKAPPPPKP
jgi:hypothetical protein